MKLTTEIITNILKERNISVTKNRIEIINCLNDEDIHFHTISDIASHTNLNTKSIYNNIKILIANGLVDSISSGGVVRYAWNENINNEKPEIHLANRKGDISHLKIPKEIFKNIKKQVETKGKEVSSIMIYVNTKD